MGTDDESSVSSQRAVEPSPEETFEPTRSGGGQLLLRSTPIDFKHGDLLAGRYQIERLVGNGASGSVFQAFDRAVRTVIAIKILKPELGSDMRWVERLGSELRHARRLQHPNVCRVFDLGEAEGHHFLTMEFASGGSLRQRMRGDDATRPLGDRIDEARAVIDGLAAIHAEGIIHRDVKPENVLCMEDGRLVVSDFGLAVAPDQTTYYSEMAGTPSYMAPEVVIGDKASTASDVWSLGVMLHELFFGRRPEWTLTGHARNLVLPEADTADPIRRALGLLCADCLVDHPPRRLRDATAVRDRFLRALHGRGRPLGTILRARRRWLATGAGIIVASSATTALLVQRKAGAPQTATTAGVLIGRATDWSGARVLLGGPERIHCVQLVGGGATARVVLGSPRRAVDVDVASGRTTPSPIAPETFQAHCPQLSPDGRALLYTKRDPDRPPRVMLSRSPSGADAVELTVGRDPRWLPSGRELVYSHDQSHIGVISLVGDAQLFPESPPFEKFIEGVAVSPRGDEIAVLFTDAQRKGLVEVYGYPSRQLLRRALLPGRAEAIHYETDGARLRLSVQDPVLLSLAELADDLGLSRVASLPGANLTGIEGSGATRLFRTARISRSVILTRDGKDEREIARGPGYGSADASRRGDLALQVDGADGRSFIAFRRAGGEKLERVSAGPTDARPTFSRDALAFAFIRRDSNSIALCTFAGSSAETPRCQDLVADALVPTAVAVSPDGRRVAYFTSSGASPRLRVVGSDRGAPRDIGAFPARCRPVWTSNARLWTAVPSTREWTEIDVASGAETGKRLPLASGDPCRNLPAEIAAHDALGVRIHENAQFELRVAQ